MTARFLMLVTTTAAMLQTTPVATHASTPAADNPGYTISVTPPPNRVQMGAPIPVKVTVAVTGSKAIPWRSYSKHTELRAFRFRLTNQAGELPKTTLHKEISGEQPPADPSDLAYSVNTTLIKPGTTVTFSVDISKLYEIPGPGSYTLTVEHLGDDGSPGVKSKPATIRVASM